MNEKVVLPFIYVYSGNTRFSPLLVGTLFFIYWSVLIILTLCLIYLILTYIMLPRAILSNYPAVKIRKSQIFDSGFNIFSIVVYVLDTATPLLHNL